MAAPVIDISLLGDAALERQLATMHDRIQKKVVRASMRAMMKIVKGRVVDKLSGAPINERTGNLRRAMAEQSVKTGRRSRTRITLSLPLPTRDELGIDPSDPWYYPAVLEYGGPGHTEYAYIRRSVDDHTSEDRAFLAADIARRLKAELLKK
jgi:hypothetical protein